jgi:hypothetical protein
MYSIMSSQAANKLSPLQLELLKVYAFEPTEEELIAVKKMLAHFFAHRFLEKVEQAAEAEGITDDDLDQWLEEDGQ